MSRKPYPTDVSDTEWDLIKSMIPAEGKRKRGKKREVDMREVVNAIFYILRAGCSWRMMPHDLPAWQTVYSYFQRWQRKGVWQKIHSVLRSQLRKIEGRDAEPSAGIIDSQTVKTTEKGGIDGYDAGKKINGRKRHILVDTMGLLLMVVVHAASIQDRDGAKLVLDKIQYLFPKLYLIWADAGYAGKLVDWVRHFIGCAIEIVKRSDDTSGFKVLPRRWVVERTLAWFGRYRRLSKDYEYHPETSETMIYAAMTHLMLRRLARNHRHSNA
ncbi:MAG: IS5 family transposase [Nostoc sp. DedQUE05]|uniref:IS5 family transposase n=1 Tax=Nostoc sp. DedQUE05 TaxID=3075391 RepID=UPI002AD38E43|nr:IS5 family transposase [Nostoc sp. DedQUE05]MDZ8096881.1 IS5 family transposase [Nostoc sp. DedQUE05]